MTTDFFDYKLTTTLDDIALPQAGERSVMASCLNPHSFVLATADGDFHRALRESSILLPDGVGVCYALRLWRKTKVEKIAGDDLHRHLLAKLDAIHGKAYYLGSTDAVLARIAARVANEYPHVAVRTHAPSFAPELPEEESLAIVDDINSFAPDVVFVSMTAPKQEKWALRYTPRIESPAIVASIGAVFDFYAETVKRAPGWAIRLNIEWLFRLVKQPRRIWRRVFISTPQFFHWVHKHRRDM